MLFLSNEWPIPSSIGPMDLTYRLMWNPHSWSPTAPGQQIPGKVHLVVVETGAGRRPRVYRETACGVRDVPTYYCTAEQARLDGGPVFEDSPSTTNLPTCDKCLAAWWTLLERREGSL